MRLHISLRDSERDRGRWLPEQRRAFDSRHLIPAPGIRSASIAYCEQSAGGVEVEVDEHVGLSCTPAVQGDPSSSRRRSDTNRCVS